MKTIKYCLLLLLSFINILNVSLNAQETTVNDKVSIEWITDKGNCLSQSKEFYGTDEAIRIAETVLLYQRKNGGWPKNYDRIQRINDSTRIMLQELKNKLNTTFDNHSTHTEIRFLTKIFNKVLDIRFKDAALRGLEYTLDAQYSNGGWPQFYPTPKWYGRHITFNDGAMIGVLSLLRDVVRDKSTYDFVDNQLRSRIENAIGMGIQCILDCQIIVNRKKTAWCAQHDEHTLKPRKARKYEPISISGYESIGIIRFLMGVNNPSPDITDAVQNAISWLDDVKLPGMKEITMDSVVAPKGWDRLLVYDFSAPPIWARFYDIETNKPIYAGGDGTVKGTLAEVDYKLRTSYRYHGYYGKYLLGRDYEKWLKKWNIKENVLKN